MSDKTKREKQFMGLVAGLNAPAKETDVEPKAKPASKRKPEPEPMPASETAPTEKETPVSITAYIPKSLHKRVRIALASRDERLTLSDLVGSLLAEWADKQS